MSPNRKATRSKRKSPISPHVSARTVISIEKGQYSPSLMLAYRMAVVFGVTVEELCCLKENKELEDLRYEEI